MTEYDIVEAFRRIEDELIASMIRNMDRHRAKEDKEGYQWSMWQAEQLKTLEKYKRENQKKYKKQFKGINQSIEALIHEARERGSMEQEIEILEAIKDGFKATRKISRGMTGEFFKLNDRKLEALIKATTHDMEKAETAVLRMANDQYRKAIFNAQVYANTGAGTYEKAVDMATKDMLAAGLNCVVYANGARHTLSNYANMALRTASKRAYLQGEGEMRQEWGISTVIMIKRGNPCPKCLPFVGKVLIDDVWSGGKKEDGPYPLMSTAIEYGLYHPLCKDSHSTYFPDISTADDAWTREELEEIGANYKQEQKQQYAERQAEKYDRLASYSLDENNKQKYAAKAKTWRSNDVIYQTEKVRYNPESDYSISIPGYNQDVNDGLTRAAIELAKKGTEDGCEHMYLVNLKDGSLEFYETNHDEGGVGYAFKKIVRENADREYAFVHNHTIKSSLSETDLITPLTFANIPVMIAVQNDGVIYYAKKIKDAPKGFWADEYFADALKTLNEDSRNGIITPAERSRKREGIVIRGLLEEFYEGMVVIDGKA